MGGAGFRIAGATLMLAVSGGLAWAERPTTFDTKIAELARRHGVPERLVHRVIMRESRYVAHAVHAGNYGLMQIRLGTAQGMGYRGTAAGLCDGLTNLTYAVPYLANAYVVAGRDEDRAVHLYARGFYYDAKRQGRLGSLQTAKSETTPVPVAAYAPAPANPVAALFQAITTPAQVAVATAQAESAAQVQAIATDIAADQTASIAADELQDDAPLPPRRPRAFSTRRFIQLAMRQEERAATGELRQAAE